MASPINQHTAGTASDAVVLRIPRNLYDIWPYPFLAHFNLYVDLMLMAATPRKVAHNRTYVHIPPGSVLYSLAFFAQRWTASVYFVRNFFQCMDRAGFVKLQKTAVHTIHGKETHAILCELRQTGYDHSSAFTYGTTFERSQQPATLGASTSYSGSGKFFARSYATSDTPTDAWGFARPDERSGERSSERSYESSSERSDERGSERSDEQGGEVLTPEIIDTYSDDTPKVRTDFGQRFDDSSDYEDELALIDSTSDSDNDNNIYIDDDDDKKNNKKKGRAKIPIPTLEAVWNYARTNNLDHVDPDYFFHFYASSGWTDKGGKPISNWKTLLVKANSMRRNEAAKTTSRASQSPPPSPSRGRRGSAADRLARQREAAAAELARSLGDQ